MALHETDIEIRGETFSLLDAPDACTALVQRTKEQLLGPVDLEGLVTNLSNLGNLLRVAYNGVAGHTDLQIKVQHIGYTITSDLADNSLSALNSFKTTSHDILELLKSAFEYLLSGQEDLAIEILEGVIVLTANKMAKTCEDLHNKLKAAKEDVIKTLDDIKRVEGSERNEKENLKKREQDLQIQKELAQQRHEDAVEAEMTAENLYSQAQLSEDEAYANHNSILTMVVDGILQIVNAGTAAASLDPGQFLKNWSEMGQQKFYKKVMTDSRKEKMKHQEIVQKQREARDQAKQQCIEFALQIKNCADDKDLAKVASEALHESAGVLQTMSTTMMAACLFWKQMAEHCENLSKNDQMKAMIEIVMTKDKEERRRVWTSNPFKRLIVHYYAKWVAFYDVCDTYMLKIKETRKDLYKFLQEYPTVEQSRQNVRHLADKLLDESKEAQKKD